MTQTLNEKQCKLVEDNHNLIYSFLKSHHLSLNAIDDWYGTAAIGLCKAALIYDEGRGVNFSVLAYCCMETEVRNVMRSNRKDINAVVSLDSEINTDGSHLSDIIPDERDISFPIHLNDAIEKAFSKMSDRDRLIVDYAIMKGMTSVSIAAKFGISQSTASRVYRNFFNQVRDYINE